LLLHSADAGLIPMARQFLQRFPQETTMDKRILAVLIAAMAGTAYAQSGSNSAYVSSASGAVSNSSGGCWATGAAGNSVACPPARAINTSATSAAGGRSTLAQADSRSAAGTTGNAFRAPAPLAGTPAPSSAAPQNDAYLMGAGTRNVVVNSAGHCVRTGSWTPGKAAEPCDAVARASLPAPVAAAPAPEPTPAPLAAAAPETPAPPVLEKITLNTDVLFPFNKAELLPGGKDKLDELAKSAQGAEVDRIVLAGYADRIGSDEYNRELSEKRAQAVADYLATKGVDQSRIQVEGRGEDNPITGDQCKRMGPEKASNKKLVSCLQPDRRVEAELLGSREVARGTTSPSTGSTTSGTTPGSSGSSGNVGGGASGSGNQ
jgi:OOP family OmpA-OmpF porin